MTHLRPIGFIACGLVLAAVAMALAAEPPPLARAPFTPAQARAYQEAWAQRLGGAVSFKSKLGHELVLIPPGEFLMGCPPALREETFAWADRVRQTTPGTERRRIEREESPQHRVRLTKPYWLGMTEVTIDQYRWFVAATGYRTESERFGGGNSAALAEPNQAKAKYTWQAPGYPVTGDTPVTQLTWNDCVRFCNWLSAAEGLAPAYREATAGEFALEIGANGYRLPTEAEWEFACRAGTTGHYSFGDDPSLLGDYAWFDRSSGDRGAQPVAGKKPNPFGLYDMHGNAWERCHDWFSEGWYAESPGENPLGPQTGSRRIARGGAWHYFDLHCRSSYRNNYAPHGRTGNIGFRLARSE